MENNLIFRSSQFWLQFYSCLQGILIVIYSKWGNASHVKSQLFFRNPVNCAYQLPVWTQKWKIITFFAYIINEAGHSSIKTRYMWQEMRLNFCLVLIVLTHRVDNINLCPQSPTTVGKLLRGITLLIVVTRVGSGCGLMMPLLLLSPPTECCMIKLTFYSINKYRQPVYGAGIEVDILKPLDIATTGFCSVVQSRVVWDNYCVSSYKVIREMEHPLSSMYCVKCMEFCYQFHFVPSHHCTRKIWLFWSERRGLDVSWCSIIDIWVCILSSVIWYRSICLLID